MAKGLTEKQRKILEYIIDFQKQNGFPPTIRELGDAFAIGSLRGVTVHLDALVRKGFMTRERTSRSIRITGPDPREGMIGFSEGTTTGSSPSHAYAGTGAGRSAKPDSTLRLPLVRPSATPFAMAGIAGEKMGIDGEIERYVSLPEEIAGSATETGFVIRVGATGVYGEPILPGDLIVVRPQRTAAPGELVVTLSHGDMSVCRAEGTDSPAIETGRELNVPEVLGRVVGLVRRY